MRTGAIFARGSCRALKWMARFGVVFAVGAGSAAAQSPAPPRNLEVAPTTEQADGTALTTANSATGGAMLLTWTEPSGDTRTVTGYQWSSDGGATWTPADAATANNANLRAAHFENLTAGAEFIFAVRAVHDIDGDSIAGETGEISDSITARERAIGLPPEPTLTAEAGDESVALSWTATAANIARPIDSYEYRYILTANVANFTEGDWIATNAAAVTVSGLQNGGGYTFQVRSVNMAGMSATPAADGDAAQASATPATTPSEPRNLTADTSGGDGQVVLSWDPPSRDGGAPVTGYEYRSSADTVWRAPNPVTGTTVTLNNLTPRRPHTFDVRAINVMGPGAMATAEATPTGDIQPPSGPERLTVFPGPSEVTLVWTQPMYDGGAPVTSYEYEMDGDGNWVSIVLVNPTQLRTTVTGLRNGQRYAFRVRGVNSAGSGEPSASMSAIPAAQVPSEPQNFTALPGDGRVTLSWSAPADDGGAAIGRYEYDVNNDGNWKTRGLSETRFTLVGLTNGQSYTFRVRAVNSVGPGATAAAQATPAADWPGTPQNLTAKAGDGHVVLAWDEPATGGAVASYEYDQDASDRWISAGSAMTHTVTGLTNGDTYVFRVRARNATGVSLPTESVKATPEAAPLGPQVTVKSVSTSTSVAESGGLTVTVTMNVPAGTKGADDKVAPIAERMVYVTFPTDDDAILARDAAEAGDTTLVGATSSGMLTWENIPRTEKASEVKRTFRVAIGQDLDAEDEKFQVSVQIDGDPKRSKVVTVDDAEEQKFKLTLDSDEKEKNTIKEGGSGTLKLEADPHKTVELPVSLVLDPNDPAKYTLSNTSGTLAARGSITSKISAKADGDRADDTITVMAYTSGTLGNDVKLTELEITVTDINALPAVEAMIVDDKGKALDPQPESVMEGETVKVMLTVVDKDGKAMKAAEKLTVSLMPSSGSSQDYRLSTHPIVIDSGDESSASVDLMIEADDDVGMEMLVFDASVAGDAKIGSDTRAVNGVLSLAVEDGTQKLVYAKTQEEIEAAIYAAKEAGMGDDMTFSPGEMMEVMGSALFSSAEGVTLTYTAESDMSGVASTSVSGGMVMVTAAGEGMAHITITAHASMPSGVKILDQTSSNMASIMFPVEVGLEALSIMLEGPEDMDVAEGMSAMVTATANRAVTADTKVMLMRDRAMSSASDDDYMADPITIVAGEMTGTTMVMAVEDNMMEDMEELVLYGMTEGMAGEVTGEVHLHLWDAAVPALPVIAQLLLAAFLAVGGYRRYRRR